LFIGENDQTLAIESFIRSIGFIVEFIMKLSSLVTLISFIVFRDSLRLENLFNGLVNELCEGGRVFTQNHDYQIKLELLMPL